MSEPGDRSLWLTKSGVLVEQLGRVRHIAGVPKVLVFRSETGGFHGLLKVANLTLLEAQGSDRSGSE